MLIHDMTRKASFDLLARTRLGRLACAYEGQPYITPMYFAYDDGCDARTKDHLDARKPARLRGG
jgi:nitroimidazol reductase NimA-like FMN-containing flavoprotein (pyridoxamine 5'-phosphate oxidase superfamily)